ncbi:uncharacterized protein [Taeniopygia guttata]|uniref:uncharacterized protein n=1 Tax=Taeniopygia guttata TaxID=59729 RepID=UPI003BB97C15
MPEVTHIPAPSSSGQESSTQTLSHLITKSKAISTDKCNVYTYTCVRKRKSTRCHRTLQIEEGTRLILNNLRYRKLPDCHRKGRFGRNPAARTELRIGRASPAERSPAPTPSNHRRSVRHRLVTAARLQSAGRRGRALGEPRVTHGAPARPAERSAPLGTGRTRRGHKEREGAAPAQGWGTQTAPTPARVPARLTDPRPGSQHGEPARKEPSRASPDPGSLARDHHPQHPSAPTSLTAAAAAPSPPAPPPYSGGRAAPIGARAATAGGGASPPFPPFPRQRGALRPAPRGVRMESQERTTDSENYRSTESWTRRGWKRSLIPPSRTVNPAPSQSPLNHISQRHIQTPLPLKHHQEQCRHHRSGQPIPLPDYPNSRRLILKPFPLVPSGHGRRDRPPAPLQPPFRQL